MLSQFIPDGLCDFHAMRRAAYFHIFPASGEDTELLGMCRRDVPRTIKINGQKDTTLPSVGGLIVKAIEGGEFDPSISLLPPHYTGQQVYEVRDVTVTGHALPAEARALGDARWDGLVQLLRQMLYDTRLTPQILHARYGVVSLYFSGLSPAIWLDDAQASIGLTTGKMQLSQGLREPFPLLFDQAEVRDLFPKYQPPSASALPKVGKEQRALEVLQELYPDGIEPEYGAVKRARSVVEERIGEGLGDTTWQRCLRKLRATQT